MEDTSDDHVLAVNLDMNPINNAFVALDVGALSSLAGDGADSTAAAELPEPSVSQKKVGRSFSRKGERKSADGDTNSTGERAPIYIHVAAGGGEINSSQHVHTPVAAGTPGGKSRRLCRRPAPWLDPRRVVLLFATLSCVGTLILLYFTLSMGKMASTSAGDADAR